MRTIGKILEWILWIYLMLIFARVVIGWLPIRWPRGMRRLVVLVYDVTEPVLSPLRRVLPILPLSGGMGLDLSPMVVILGILILQWIVRSVFY